MCLHCYLTCTLFSNSYLRVFVNRDDTWKAIMRKHEDAAGPTWLELGSNSEGRLPQPGNRRRAAATANHLGPRGEA